MIASAARGDERPAISAECGMRSAECQSRSSSLRCIPHLELRTSIAANARRHRKFERELCADAHVAVDADAGAVGFDDSPGRGQAEAAAAALGCIERVEHLHGGTLVHADTRVD